MKVGSELLAYLSSTNDRKMNVEREKNGNFLDRRIYANTGRSVRSTASEPCKMLMSSYVNIYITTFHRNQLEREIALNRTAR